MTTSDRRTILGGVYTKRYLQDRDRGAITESGDCHLFSKLPNQTTHGSKYHRRQQLPRVEFQCYCTGGESTHEFILNYIFIGTSNSANYARSAAAYNKLFFAAIERIRSHPTHKDHSSSLHPTTCQERQNVPTYQESHR